MSAETRLASIVIGRYCANCHMMDGEGGSVGPGSVAHRGSRHDAKWLRDWITQPDAVDPLANMPAFGEVLSANEMTVIVNYLAARK